MNEVLRTELIRRMETDQGVRKSLPIDRERMASIDDENATWIREVIEISGWPGKSLVGEDGARAAFLLVQHAPQDLQEHCLPLLEKAVGDGEAAKRHWAYLFDRVLMRRGQPQVYGTQFITRDGETVAYAISDPDSVDVRRAELGLEPMTEYTKRMTRQ